MSGAARIGLVGLGAMGGPIAEALQDAGHGLVVHDREAAAVAGAVRRGATAAPSPRAVADAATVVLVSLPTPDVVLEVACGADGLVEGDAIEVYVDLSTTGAQVAAKVAGRLGARGVEVLDSPVSGGVAGAAARTLAVMAAGERHVYERVKPLLDTFGGTVLHVGERPGQGQVAKLLNNLLSATALAVSAEALTFGVRAGLDPTTLLAVFNAGSGRNTATTDKLPKHVLTRGFGSGFRLELMAKDLDLCLAEARAERFPMLLGSAVQQLWSLARATAAPGADHTEVVRLFEGWAGVELRAGEVSADA